eukprot:TRINITY_DN9717_c0_g1_i1.p1 TRINITY_DN9717_c0_g1~~TRINITY_DN9717_c0_g1_i1.p1  ORF type:complete len:308 (+),score=40.79 TRINITY_DN9717_c0_g1_i1:25-924(+)
MIYQIIVALIALAILKSYFPKLVLLIKKVDYKGKRIIITGASSGIGEYLVYEYARKNAILVLAARRSERLVVVAEKAKNLGAVDVMIVQCDVTDEESCKNLVQQTVDKYKGIDILILNAGASGIIRFEDCKNLDVHRQLMNTNYFGCITITFYAIKYLRASKGKIVVISSLAGKTATPLRSAYSGSKFALHGFYDALRYEVSPDVQITIVCPGFVISEIHDKAITADGKKLERNISSFMKTDVCAKLIQQAEAEGTRELVMTWKANLFNNWLHPFIPYFLKDALIRKMTLGGFANKSDF